MNKRLKKALKIAEELKVEGLFTGESLNFNRLSDYFKKMGSYFNELGFILSRRGLMSYDYEKSPLIEEDLAIIRFICKKNNISYVEELEFLKYQNPIDKIVFDQTIVSKQEKKYFAIPKKNFVLKKIYELLNENKNDEVAKIFPYSDIVRKEITNFSGKSPSYIITKIERALHNKKIPLNIQFLFRSNYLIKEDLDTARFKKSKNKDYLEEVALLMLAFFMLLLAFIYVDSNLIIFGVNIIFVSSIFLSVCSFIVLFNKYLL